MIYDYNDNHNVATGFVSILPVLQSADSGCADTVNVPGNGNPTSVVNVNKTADLKVYPNPVSGSVTIQAPGDKMNTVVVYNLVGTEVFKDSINGCSMVIDMSSFSKGMYLYKVQMNDNSTVTGKLLKE
ncbi:MAG: T9SS type A sorting domain-containing protein [Flavipsychrobacter sp.]